MFVAHGRVQAGLQVYAPTVVRIALDSGFFGTNDVAGHHCHRVDPCRQLHSWVTDEAVGERRLTATKAASNAQDGFAGNARVWIGVLLT